MANKLNFSNLKQEEKEQLKEYGAALKEIKKAISELVNKAKGDNTSEIQEKKIKIGGNNSTGLHYKIK